MADIKEVILAGSIALCMCPTWAVGSPDNLGAEIGISTLGLGIEGSYAFNDTFSASLGLNHYKYSTSDVSSDIDYDIDLKLQSIALLGNYFPFHGVFRISAGIFSNDNKISMDAKPAGSYDIGNSQYSAADIGTLTAKVSFNKIAPYLGIGWGKRESKGFGMTGDIGVLFQGSPKLEMTATGPITDPSNPLHSQFTADLERERQSAQDDLSDFKMYPVLGIGLSYRF